MTPMQYARTQIAAGRFADMAIVEFCGAFYLCDSDYNLLKGKAFSSRDIAQRERSKVIDRALKAAL